MSTQLDITKVVYGGLRHSLDVAERDDAACAPLDQFGHPTASRKHMIGLCKIEHKDRRGEMDPQRKAVGRRSRPLDILRCRFVSSERYTVLQAILADQTQAFFFVCPPPTITKRTLPS